MTFRLLNADCLIAMQDLEPESFDSIVTDPPYGLGFMGRAWDHGVPGVPFWIEALRVAKPGAYLAAFGGTRTFHRLACAIEDAGWEMRDTAMWVYGSGFPKSHNGEWGGTALKPAWEPIILARKPLVGTVEANWRKYGTGGLNIDQCRVETNENLNGGAYAKVGARKWSQCINFRPGATTGKVFEQPAGRWPANLIHDGNDEVLAAFPDAPGQQADVSDAAPSVKTSTVYGPMKRVGEPSQDSENEGALGFKMRPGARRLDTGSAARFFYCAKASRKERNEGCEGLPRKPSGMVSNTSGQHITRRDGGAPGPSANHHPTVKPTQLMRWLCRLITPAGGLVLDPFAGSGSTGKAALREEMSFVGIEKEAEYVTIARARLKPEGHENHDLMFRLRIAVRANLKARGF